MLTKTTNGSTVRDRGIQKRFLLRKLSNKKLEGYFQTKILSNIPNTGFRILLILTQK